MSIKDITQAKLDSFTGTESYRWSDFRKLKLTDGAQFLQDNGAAWLIGAIESYQGEKYLKGIEFQIWELALTPVKGYAATLKCREDSDEPMLVQQNFGNTDFPLSEVKLYVQNGVLMLPSEY